MAEKDPETEKLELSLFRRKRKKDASAPVPEAESAPAPEPAPEPEPTPAPEPEPAPASQPAPAPESAPVDASAVDAPTADDTQVLPAAGRRKAATTTAPSATRGSGGARVAPKPRRQPVQLPVIAPALAVLVVGAIVGLAAVALTFASLQLCELITSTDSCGGPGLIVLLAVVVLMILGGSAALRMLGVPEPGGLSFLGVAMFVAICLVVLLPSLLEIWMIAVAPVLCAITFWVAHWIVTRFDEEILVEDGPPPHDVR